jgi:hypothetical protein
VTRALALLVFFAARASAQAPGVDAVDTEWNVEASGCHRSAHGGWACADGVEAEIVLTATRGTTPITCDALADLRGGLAGAPASCDVDDGIAYLDVRGHTVLLRTHPESLRLVMVYGRAPREQLLPVVASLVPRLGVTAPAARTLALEALDVTIPAGAWASEERAADHVSLVVTSPPEAGVWLSLVPRTTPCPRFDDESEVIDVAGVSRSTARADDSIETCIELTRDGERTRHASTIARFPSSPAAIAFAESILRAARPRTGWTAIDERTGVPWLLLGGLGALAAVAIVVVLRRRR